ncbi:hypothetical protein M422DRAFT_256793 [Sphaerobolus stellatus SS14]|uniref:Uncharacterized protein n=1 Tax=Sphaerobolus stellatus (strain SS14) TaxID=990650 RepID=A0A0C9UAS8_SPHS4|nr:hypothetical protein M422DRAFT_256793 [Sphaerobolus stellatus SS14]
MQVDLSTSTVSAIQAFCSDPSTRWVIESALRFLAIKHKMGCPICNMSMSHCMAAKWAYEIFLAEKDISKAIADAWPELASDIPVSDSEADDKDLAGLPTLPEEIPQDIPSCPPTILACSASKTTKNAGNVIHEAGIPAVTG